MTTMRPSPQPRSYRISPLLTSPSFNKASTTSGGVGTYGTFPRGASGAWAASAAAARIRLHSTCARQKPLRGAENGNVRLILMVASVPPSSAPGVAEFRHPERRPGERLRDTILEGGVAWDSAGNTATASVTEALRLG